MKAIHADPRDIRKLFVETFIIPEFQRPYSWDLEQCEKLWEDITDFYYEKNNSEKYFLGNIVIHPQDNDYSVIDGQQRLTTLQLLIKALHQKAGTVKALEECLKKKDPLTSELTNEPRVISSVFDDDKESLHDVIFNNGNNLKADNKFKVNYEYFNKVVEQWWLGCGNDPDELNRLILTLLNDIVLLPIHCDSQDDALVIFQTINDRGMALSDADIFKAKLHSVAEDKEVFITKWNSIDDHLWYFRILMHITRAKRNDTSKEKGLRAYFDDKTKLQEKYDFVMERIQMSYDIESWEANTKICILWAILDVYPNYYWNFPLFVYLNKHGFYENGEFTLSEDRMLEFESLIEETLKYFYIKGVVYNTVNAVRDTVFKVCALIESEGEYLKEYSNSLKNDLPEFKRRVEDSHYGRYLRGLVLLGAYLNEEQDDEKYSKFIYSNYHIEHILPKKWNNYDNWTDDSWSENINKLGNLVPLEWKLNISAQNEFFNRKKERYKKSDVQDVIELMDSPHWYPGDLEKRHEIIVDRIFKYFE